MSDFIYLTTSQVVRINEKLFGGAVREFGTVDAATMRCRHSYDGAEFYPTLWDKAALLWALTTTQGFTDGNKRTAWAAMETFLTMNGGFIEATTNDAHVFMLAIANKAIDQEQIVEWLREHRVA